MAQNDGGPAFPTVAGQTVYSHGMTLRDWFAGQVLAGLMVNSCNDYIDDAVIAYKQADAMLEARKK